MSPFPAIDPAEPRRLRREMQVAFDLQSERTAHGGQLGDTGHPQLGRNLPGR